MSRDSKISCFFVIGLPFKVESIPNLKFGLQSGILPVPGTLTVGWSLSVPTSTNLCGVAREHKYCFLNFPGIMH